jgi:hypothetical protein
VSASRHGYTVVDPAMGRLARLIIDDVVDQLDPDALVLDDYFTFCGVLQDRFGLDPWFVDEYSLPVFPIDIWEWENSTFVVDSPPGRGFDVSKRILDFEAHLRPVPLAHVDATGRGFPYRLGSPARLGSADDRTALRSSLGLGAADRLVLLTLAAWQRSAQSALFVTDRVTATLRRLDECVHVLLVGAGPGDFEALPAERTHRVPACDPAQFDDLLGSADLLLSLNAGSTSLARAVLAGMDAVVIGNSATVPGSLYPFRMWPLGAHEFLAPVLAANAYTGAYVQAELLDTAATAATIERTLHDPSARHVLAEARAKYQANVAALPPTCEVFDQAARLVGLTL